MMQQTIKVIIADDHEIFLMGLKALLKLNNTVEVIAEAAGGKRLIDLCNHLLPHVVLTDLKMPEVDGIAAIKAITTNNPQTKCIAVTTLDSEISIVDALEAGALGYIMKNSQKDEVTEAIKTVFNGNPYYCKGTTLRLAKLILKSKFNPYKKSVTQIFSETEIKIIRLICEEKTSEEIGKCLFIGTRTVEGIRSRILEKMNVKTSIGIVIYAIKNELYPM